MPVVAEKTKLLIQQLQDDFLPIGDRWKALKTETGAFLTKAQTICSVSQFKFLQSWLRDSFRITLSEQGVFMRMHNENIPDIVVDKIPASTLLKIAPANIPDPDKIYMIMSPDAGGPVGKRLRDFTPADVKTNIGVHGVRNLAESDAEVVKPIVSCRATAYRIDGKDLVLFVRSLNKEIRIVITSKLKAAIRDFGG